MSTLEARIAEVLGAHGYRIEHDAAGSGLATIVCVCGNRYGFGATHLAHQAAMLALVIADAKAEALREAVSDFQHSVGVGEFDEQTRRDGNRHAHIDEAWEYQSPYMDWLLNRADNLEAS